MNNRFIAIAPGEAAPPLWEVGRAREVERAALRIYLGQPLYVETDSRSTFGGEEDWWSYRIRTGHVVAVCLRVPYKDAMLCASEPSGTCVEQARELLQPWQVELFAEPRLRGARTAPNPSIERTASSGLRPPPAAAHVKR